MVLGSKMVMQTKDNQKIFLFMRNVKFYAYKILIKSLINFDQSFRKQSCFKNGIYGVTVDCSFPEIYFLGK